MPNNGVLDNSVPGRRRGIDAVSACPLGRKSQALLAATLPWLINVGPALAIESGHLPRAIVFAAIASPLVFALVWRLPIVRVDDETAV